MDAAKAVAARVRAGVSKVADQVRLRAGQARDLAVKAFNGAKTEIARRVGMIGSNLRAAGSALLNRIRQGLQIAGSVIDVLFPGARGLVDRITSGIERGIERAKAIAATVKAKLAAAKDNVVAFVRAKADEALKNAIKLSHTIGEKLAQATKWIADHKMQILAAVPGGLLIGAVAVRSPSAPARFVKPQPPSPRRRRVSSVLQLAPEPGRVQINTSRIPEAGRRPRSPSPRRPTSRCRCTRSACPAAPGWPVEPRSRSSGRATSSR